MLPGCHAGSRSAWSDRALRTIRVVVGRLAELVLVGVLAISSVLAQADGSSSSGSGGGSSGSATESDERSGDGSSSSPSGDTGGEGGDDPGDIGVDPPAGGTGDDGPAVVEAPERRPGDGSSGGTSDTGDSTSPVGDSSCEAGSDSEFFDPNCTAGDSFSPEDRPARQSAPRAEEKPGQTALATLAVLLFLIVFTAWIAVGIRRARGGDGS